jgi:hypothetical protein
MSAIPNMIAASVPDDASGTREIGFAVPARYNASRILFDNIAAKRGYRLAVSSLPRRSNWWRDYPACAILNRTFRAEADPAPGGGVACPGLGARPRRGHLLAAGPVLTPGKERHTRETGRGFHCAASVLRADSF